MVSRFHEAAAKYLSGLAEKGSATRHLSWAVQAQYHATLLGKPELVPTVGKLMDGALGAARRLVHQHRDREAKPLIDSLLKSYATPEVYELGAIVYARLGLCEEALHFAKKANELDSMRIWILSEVGRLALNVRQQYVAQEAIRVVTGRGYRTTHVAVLEGRIAQQRGDTDDAEAAFRRGTELARAEGRDGWPFFYLGRLLAKKGRLDLEQV